MSALIRPEALSRSEKVLLSSKELFESLEPVEQLDLNAAALHALDLRDVEQIELADDLGRRELLGKCEDDSVPAASERQSLQTGNDLSRACDELAQLADLLSASRRAQALHTFT